MATLNQRQNEYKFIHGWYGKCEDDDTECVDFDLTGLNKDVLYKVFIYDDQNKGFSYEPSLSIENNDFTKLKCGFGYMIVLKPGSSFLEIPGFVATYANQEKKGMLADSCVRLPEDTPTPTPTKTPSLTPTPSPTFTPSATKTPTPTSTTGSFYENSIQYIENLWIGFLSQTAYSHSQFFKVRGSEEKLYRIVLDNVATFNIVAKTLGGSLIGEDDGQSLMYNALANNIVFPWINLPSELDADELDGKYIYVEAGELVIYYKKPLSYTRFEICEPDYETKLNEYLSSNVNLVTEVIMLDSLIKPSYEAENFNDLLNKAFNFPGKLDLVCDGVWDYQNGSSAYQLEFLLENGKVHSYEPVGSNLKYIRDDGIDMDKKKWVGANMVYYSNSGMSNTDTDKPLLNEFYFKKLNGDKLKLSEGNPTGSIC